MLEHFDRLETKLVEHLYSVFLIKFEGNKTKFAIASECSETTIRRVFLNKQRMTLNLFLRFCLALELSASELLNEIENN